MEQSATPQPQGPVQFTDPQRSRTAVYLIIAVVLFALVVIGLMAYRRGEKTPAAQQKAEQLQQAFVQAGLPVPGTKQIINTLGDDGGAVCASPENALKQATRNGLATNGAAGPGIRPVFVARALVTGETLVLTVYCPDKLPGFLNYINQQKLADTVKE